MSQISFIVFAVKKGKEKGKILNFKISFKNMNLKGLRSRFSKSFEECPWYFYCSVLLSTELFKTTLIGKIQLALWEQLSVAVLPIVVALLALSGSIHSVLAVSCYAPLLHV